MFAVTEQFDSPTWRPTYCKTAGAVVLAGKSRYGHRFGGESWKIDDPDPILQAQTRLSIFELIDPIFAPLKTLPLDEPLGEKKR